MKSNSISDYSSTINKKKLMIFFRYIEENYSKIRDVERELGNLTMEMKLTAGPKKAGWCIIMTSYCHVFIYVTVE